MSILLCAGFNVKLKKSKQAETAWRSLTQLNLTLSCEELTFVTRRNDNLQSLEFERELNRERRFLTLSSFYLLYFMQDTDRRSKPKNVYRDVWMCFAFSSIFRDIAWWAAELSAMFYLPKWKLKLFNYHRMGIKPTTIVFKPKYQVQSYCATPTSSRLIETKF